MPIKPLVLTIMLPVCLASLEACERGATHKILVRGDAYPITAAEASVCGRKFRVEATGEGVSGSFSPTCPGPLVISVRSSGANVECRLGYIDSSEPAKEFEFLVKNGACTLVRDQQISKMNSRLR